MRVVLSTYVHLSKRASTGRFLAVFDGSGLNAFVGENGFCLSYVLHLSLSSVRVRAILLQSAAKLFWLEHCITFLS